MKVRVKLFSSVRDLAGFSEEIVDVGMPARAGSVLDYLIEKNPRIADWRKTVRLAVNQNYVDKDHSLNEGDEVAVIPPVSGG